MKKVLCVAALSLFTVSMTLGNAMAGEYYLYADFTTDSGFLGGGDVDTCCQ